MNWEYITLAEHIALEKEKASGQKKPAFEGFWKKEKIKSDLEWLNDLGKEGWEIVSVVPIIGVGLTTNSFAYFLKRPKK